MTTLTNRQRDVLFVVQRNSPITPADLAYHLPGMTESAARAALSRLERRSLVDATYTNVGWGRGRAYFVTEKGETALDNAR